MPAYKVEKTDDIRVLSQRRYIIVKTLNTNPVTNRGRRYTYRVISICGNKPYELTRVGTSSACAPAYRFARRTGGTQMTFTQGDLSRFFITCSPLRSTNAGTMIKAYEYIMDNIVELRAKRDSKTDSVSTAECAVSIPGLNSTFWIIGSMGLDGVLSTSNNPKMHNTLKSAEAEQERLVNIEPGRTFIIMKAESAAVKAQVIRKKL